MTNPLTFTDANGDTLAIVARRAEPPYWRDATLDDLCAALPEGYALVRTLGVEPTEGEVLALDDRSALYNAGRAAGRAAEAASRQSEVDRLTARVAELEQRLALIAVLAHDRDGDSHEWRSRRLGDCSALTQFTKDRGVLGHVKLADSWAKRAEAAESELAATNEKLADAERERDVGYDALDVLMEREDRAKTELARERDDARAELTATKAKLAEVTALREGDLTALSKSCNELSAALADRAELRTKLAEVERERDAVQARKVELEADRAAIDKWSRDRIDDIAQLRSELERERRVVEAVNAILEKGPRYTDRHLDAAADAVVDEIREAMALASATSSQPSDVDASVITSGKSISEQPAEAGTGGAGTEDSGNGGDANAEDVREHGDRNSSDNGRRVGAEAHLEPIGNGGSGSVGSGLGQTSSEAVPSGADRWPPTQPEPPTSANSPEIPDGSKPQEEPRPSGERPFWDSPLPWRIVDEEDFATLVRVVDANGENVARCASDDDARFIVSRCNAAEPAARARGHWRAEGALAEVEALERWFRLRSEAALAELSREAYETAANKVKALLAKGGGAK